MRDFDFFFAAANGFPRLRPFSSPYSINIQNQTKGSFSKEAFFPSFLPSAPHFLEIDGKRRKVRSADAFSTLEMCESLFWQTEECVLCNRALVEIRTFLRKSPPLLPRTIIYHLHYYTNKKASFFPVSIEELAWCNFDFMFFYLFLSWCASLVSYLAVSFSTLCWKTFSLALSRTQRKGGFTAPYAK